jgi:hypothetical protein
MRSCGPEIASHSKLPLPTINLPPPVKCDTGQRKKSAGGQTHAENLAAIARLPVVRLQTGPFVDSGRGH